MDCDMTGVEPDIALVSKAGRRRDDEDRHQTVPMALWKLGYTPQQVDAIIDHINVQETITRAVRNRTAVFDCAFKAAKAASIHYMATSR
jgi:ribonucleoside-diphosphate reductase alpha chain